jgi:hypothetical protein
MTMRIDPLAVAVFAAELVSLGAQVSCLFVVLDLGAASLCEHLVQTITTAQGLLAV